MAVTCVTFPSLRAFVQISVPLEVTGNAFMFFELSVVGKFVAFNDFGPKPTN